LWTPLRGQMTDTSARRAEPATPLTSVDSARAPIKNLRHDRAPLKTESMRAPGLWRPTDRVQLPQVNHADLAAEDALRDIDFGTPRRIGIERDPIGGPLNPDNSGSWANLSDNAVAWTLEIESPDALGLRVHFSDFSLPLGARVTVTGSLDADGMYFVGRGPTGTQEFWTPTFSGDRVRIEYYAPPAGLGAPRIEIDHLNHIYRDWRVPVPGERDTIAGGLLPCEEDVNCHTVDAVAKASVGAMIFTEPGVGTFVCTGALLNDADPNTFAGYFLTAHHCISDQPTANTLQVRWFYETLSCNGPTSFGPQSFGATLLATSSLTDFTLLRLWNDPSDGQGFAAWSISPPSGTVYGIHHPGGSWKRYSEGFTTTAQPICGNLPLANFVYNDWTVGVIEGGSSGSPLFNSNWEVVGQLFGVCYFSTPGCDNPQSYNNVYGRFSKSYTSMSAYLGLITPDDPYEDNDELAAAPVLAFGSHALRLVDFDDFFTVNAECGELSATVTYSSSDMSVLLRLYDDTGTVIDSAFGSGGVAAVSANVFSGTYIVHVEKTGGWGGDYTLDLSNGLANDCNNNGLRDQCEIQAGTAQDCNGNVVPDECDLASGTEADCNGNLIPDTCDTQSGFSQDCNTNQIPDECEVDCNGNVVPDDCDIASGTSQDCNANGVPDECDVAGGEPDCNVNGVPDTCDIDSGTSTDCNTNGVPDDCDLLEPGAQDCQPNGVLDECELGGIAHRYAFAVDASDDVGGVPGQLVGSATVSGGVLNLDGVSAACTIDAPLALPGRSEMTFEVWSTWSGGGNVQRVFDVTWQAEQYLLYVSPSVFGTAMLTVVDHGSQHTIPLGPAFGVGVPLHLAVTIDPPNDEIRVYRDGAPVATSAPAGVAGLDLSTSATIWLAGGDAAGLFAGDIDEFRIYNTALTTDQILWSYTVSTDASSFAGGDCDADLIPDDCQEDCNTNGVNDVCDIASGYSVDVNGTGVPDECECPIPLPPAAGQAVPANRYLLITGTNAGAQTAIRVTTVPPLPTPLWVGPPAAYPEEDASQPGRTFSGARLQCTPHFDDWGSVGVFAVFGAEIVPDASYELRTIRDCVAEPFPEQLFSEPLLLNTAHWGDVGPLYDGDDPGAPQPDFNDIAAAVGKFLADPDAPIKAQAQLQPNVVLPDRSINFKDIAAVVSAFLGDAYVDVIPDVGPCTCPSAVTCGAVPCGSDLACAPGFCINGFCTDKCGRCEP